MNWRKQNQIVEEAHAGIGWVLLSHGNEVNMKADYRKAKARLMCAVEMIEEMLGEVVEKE